MRKDKPEQREDGKYSCTNLTRIRDLVKVDMKALQELKKQIQKEEESGNAGKRLKDLKKELPALKKADKHSS